MRARRKAFCRACQVNRCVGEWASANGHWLSNSRTSAAIGERLSVQPVFQVIEFAQLPPPVEGTAFGMSDELRVASFTPQPLSRRVATVRAVLNSSILQRTRSPVGPAANNGLATTRWQIETSSIQAGRGTSPSHASMADSIVDQDAACLVVQQFGDHPVVPKIAP